MGWQDKAGCTQGRKWTFARLVNIPDFAHILFHLGNFPNHALLFPKCDNRTTFVLVSQAARIQAGSKL
jgi:hypothetical protein